MAILERRKLGRTGWDVTCIGLGGAGIGGEYGKVKEPAAIWTIRKAIASGVNFIDASPAYGEAELYVGKGLTKNEREKTILSTKLTFACDEPFEIEVEMEKSIKQSLENLRTDRIDILTLHRWLYQTPRGVWAISADAVLREGGYLDCMRRWKEKGVVRAIGFTGYGEYDAIKRVIESDGFDVCEVEYSLLHRNALLEGVDGNEPEPLHALAARHGLGVLGMRPLAGGALAGRPPRRSDAETVRDRQMADLLAQHITEVPLAQASLTFALMNQNLSCVLVGCRQPEEIEQIAQWSKLPPPSEDLLQQVERFRDRALI